MKSKTLIIGLLLLLAFASPVEAVNWPKIKKMDKEVIDHYKTTKEKYLQSVKFYKDARKDYLNFRKKRGVWQNLSEEDKLKHLDKAKEFLLRANEATIAYLERVKAKVERMAHIDENKKANIIVEIDKDIGWLKAKQEAIKNASSPQELQEIARQAREYWHRARGRVKRLLGQALRFRLNNIFSRMDRIREKIAAAIDKLKEQGKDTTQLEARLADFDKNLALAKEKYELAKDKFNKMSNVAQADQLFRQGHAFLKEVHQYLRQAHQDLKNIVKELNRAKS